MDDSNTLMTGKETYEFFLLLQTLDDLKRSFIMALAHIYPKQVTATQLAMLAGYSAVSKYVFKSGALTALEKEELIIIKRPTKRLMLIQLNPTNKLLMIFSNICNLEGRIIQETLLGKLLEES